MLNGLISQDQKAIGQRLYEIYTQKGLTALNGFDIVFYIKNRFNLRDGKWVSIVGENIRFFALFRVSITALTPL